MPVSHEDRKFVASSITVLMQRIGIRRKESADPVASRRFFLYGYENIYGRKPRF